MSQTVNPANVGLPPVGIDHFVYASSTLGRGMDEIEALLGVRPVPGGRHPQFGTHNALLSLGPDTYLEVIARDPGLPAPGRGRLVDLPDGQASRLITWVLRVDDIEKIAGSDVSAKSGIGAVESGSRQQADGSLIEWQLTDPYAMPMDGAIPFLIDWGDTVHPANVAPRAGRLTGFTIEHPNANRVREALSALDASVEVVNGAGFKLIARIRTKDGVRILE